MNPTELKDIFKLYIDKIDHPILALETGCSHQFVPENMTNLSTPNIIEHLIKPTNGLLYSLDNDADHIEICRHALAVRGLDQYVQFLQGDSVGRINGVSINDSLRPVNFVWFDSLEDSDHAIAEFNAIQRLLADKHIICVDDYGNPNSVKWQLITDQLYARNYDIATFASPTGLIVGFKN